LPRVIRSRLVASSLTLSLALSPACKKDEPAAPTPASAAADAKADAHLDGTLDPKQETTTAVPEPAPPVDAPIVPALAELDPLLDMLPVGATEFMIVRDPKSLVQTAAWFVTGERDALTRLQATKMAESKPDPELERLLRDADVIASAILGSVIQLDRGIVVVEHAGESITLVASPDAAAIPALVAKINGATDTSAIHCKPVPAQDGWVGCASKAEAIDAFVAGKQAADQRKQLLVELAGSELDRANVIARFGTDAGTPPSVVAIETSPGELELHIGHPALAEVDKMLAPGTAPALGLVPPAGTFAWARASSFALDDAKKQAPAPFGTAAASVSGELMFAYVEKAGLAALVGVTDPNAVTGLLPLVALAKDQIPKQLPDGSELAVEVREVDDGSGKPRSTVLAKVKPSAELEKSIAAMGLAPEAVVFASGGYAAAVLGGGETSIATIAQHIGSGPTPGMLAALPAGLQRALKADAAEAILHISLDGLQSSAVRRSLVEMVASQPGVDADTSTAIAAMLDLAAPISSLSMWLTRDAGVHTVHLAIRTFDDYATEEGKAARAAMIAAGSGGDPSAAYSELSTKYASSPRAASYDMRAGKGASIGQAASSAFLGGIIAAIAIPAFTKYRARAEAAAKAPK
jgi:hypothetical protein